MNQPSEIIPSDTQTAPTKNTSKVVYANSPLVNLFRRLRKSEKARGKTRGAFGGKARSARHQGRF